MKKYFYTLLVILASSIFSIAQDQKAAAPVQFSKAELLAFPDLKALLSAINKGQDYSKYMVRNFNLTTASADVSKSAAPISEMGPGGVWSEKQKDMIEQYAKKGVVFTLNNIVLVESGKKGSVNPPNVSFSIKE